MSSHSPHRSFLQWLNGIINPPVPQPMREKWERTRAQETGGFRIIHQNEKPIYEPLPDGLRDRAFQAQFTPPGQEQERQTGEIQPVPRASDTEGIKRIAAKVALVPPQQDPRILADFTTVKQLGKIPEWVLAAIPGKSMPALRPDYVPPQSQIAANEEQLDDMLMTLPPERMRVAGDSLDFSQVATFMTPEALQQRAIEEFDKRQTSMPLMPPVLAPLSPQSLATEDRIASPIPGVWPGSNVDSVEVWGEPEPPESAFTELMRHNSTTLELPSVTEQIAKQHRKESE
jgi:hypothetical protein